MSSRLACKVWTSTLDKTIKPLAAALANFADEDGRRVYPSVEYLARIFSSDRRTIQRKLSTLRELGLLVRETDGRGGRSVRTHYRLVEEMIPDRLDYKGRQNRSETAALVSHKGGVSVAKERHQCRPEIEEKRQIENAAGETSCGNRKPNQRAPWQVRATQSPNRLLDAIGLVDRLMLRDRLTFTEAVAQLRAQPEFAERGDDLWPMLLSYFKAKRGME